MKRSDDSFRNPEALARQSLSHTVGNPNNTEICIEDIGGTKVENIEIQKEAKMSITTELEDEDGKYYYISMN